MRRFFVDTEFIENGKTIDLISIGIVDDLGREYYAVNLQCQFDKASDWVQKNVFPGIGVSLEGDFNLICLPKEEKLITQFRGRKDIAEEVLAFINQGMEAGEELQIWGDYSHYDYVTICQLWGEMVSLPKELPYYCFDVQTAARVIDEIRGKDCLSITCQFPEDLETEGNHNALLGAQSCKQRFEVIRGWIERLQL